jgi:hypothetical protein
MMSDSTGRLPLDTSIAHRRALAGRPVTQLLDVVSHVIVIETQVFDLSALRLLACVIVKNG